MKEIINIMIKRSALLILTLGVIGFSCNDDDPVAYETGGVAAISDPYLQVATPVVSFQAGTEKYGYTFNSINGTKDISKVEIYSVFTDAATGGVSDPVLFKTFTITSSKKQYVTDTITYADLKSGVTVGGNPLPDSDSDLAVGSGWALSFVGVRPNGDEVPLAGAINIAVLSPYAGLYEVTASEYYRIGVFTADWTGGIRFIGSVDESTFSYNDFWGNFGWGGNAFNFSIDFATNVVTVPIIVNGIFSGNRALDCAVEPGTFTKVSCDGSNVLIPDPADPTSGKGQHIIKLTYGYFTDGSGPREFQEELTKVVD